MVFINSIKTATPEWRYTTSQIIEAASEWLRSTPKALAKMQRFASASMIDERSFSIPLQDVLQIGGLRNRTDIFSSIGKELATATLRQNLSVGNIHSSKISHLIFTSCTVPMIPTLDVSLCEELSLPPTVRRVPLFQYGCAGGAASIGLAKQLGTSAKNWNGVAAIVNLELCSLLHQPSDTEDGTLVGATLFGDGVSTLLVSNAPGPLEIMDSASHLLTGTADLLGYELHDDGLYLRLDRKLPLRLAEVLPEIVGHFLQENNLSLAGVRHWLLHPGGAKILSSIEQVLAIDHSQCRWSWEVLRKHGNTSSAAIGFVMEKFLAESDFIDGDLAVALAIGPGVSVELSLLRCHK